MKVRFTMLLALAAFWLSSCSLAEDITPPPNYQSPTPASTLSPLFPAQAPDLASGATIFAAECAPCHGEKGLGDGPMAAQLQKQPPALGQPEIARAAAPAAWYALVTEGRMQNFMPPFSNKLSDQQRWEVVAYALSLGTTSAELATGETVYAANCAQCHGKDGQASSQADLTDQARMAKLNQNDIAGFVNQGLGTMPGFSGTLAAAEVNAVAAYVRTFTFPVAAAPAVTPAATPAPFETPVATAIPVEALGNVSGKVTNGSGGAIPAGLKAVLHTFDHNSATQQFSEAATQEAPVSAAGAYLFTDLSMAPTRAYYVSVEYSGTTYESEPAIPQQTGKTSYDLPVTIYETTTDNSGLAASQVHLILDYSKPEVVQVIEFFVVANPGNKTVISAEKGGPVISVPLPKDYTNLQFEQSTLGERYSKTESGFADTQPVMPGVEQYQLVFAFDLPLPKPGLFGGQKLEFTQPLSIRADSVSVLVPEGVTFSNSAFTSGGLQDMGTGGKFQVYTAANLPAGEAVEIVVSGAPKAAGQAVTVATGADTTRNIIIGFGALGVVLILAGAWLYWRDRNRDDEVDDEAELDEETDESSAEDTDEILDAILALEDQFKAGNLAEAAYKERRAELKAKLKGKF